MAKSTRQSKSEPTDSWASLLSKAIQDDADCHPGEGWKTFEEIHKEYAIGESRLRRLLTAKMDTGEIERTERFLMVNKDSRRKSRRVFYRVKG